MDHTFVSNLTLQKMTNAAERGVLTILIIDDLNYYASRKHVEILEAKGGIVIRNNLFRNVSELIS